MYTTGNIGPNKDDAQHVWREIGLVAIPILVICVTVAFSPPTSKGFWPTIVSKPEWYFLTLVFCIEAHRDRARIERRENRSDELGMIFLALAAVLSGLAAAASIAVGPVAMSIQSVNGTTVSIIERALEFLQNPLQFFAIPIFVVSAIWSGVSKYRLKCIEAAETEQNQMLLDVRRPLVYSVDHDKAVRNFYDMVASEYNKRNEKTKGIRNAQDEVIQAIRRLAKVAPSDRIISVLDIGGGTGHNVFNVLRNEEKIKWISLDLSPGMTAKFNENFPGVLTITGDCLDLSGCLAEHPGKFDAIVLSFALSSMPRNLDFAAVQQILKPGGELLISDIHPGYVSKSPCFDVEIGVQTHALKLRKVEPLILEHQAATTGLSRVDWRLFENERGEMYSFFMRFLGSK